MVVWQAAAAAATAEIEFSSDDVDEEVDMMEDEVEPVSLVVSAPTSDRTEVRRPRHDRSGICTGIESGLMKCWLGGKPNSSLIAYSSACSNAFSRVSSSTRVSSNRSEIRRFSRDRLAASLFFLRRSQYVSSLRESGMNSRCLRVQRTFELAAWISFDRLIMPAGATEVDGSSSSTSSGLLGSPLARLASASSVSAVKPSVGSNGRLQPLSRLACASA